MKFYLHPIPLIAASMVDDVELAAATAYIALCLVHYPESHKHSWAEWAGQNKANYAWMQEFGAALCNKWSQQRKGERSPLEPFIKGDYARPPAKLAARPYKFTPPIEEKDADL